MLLFIDGGLEFLKLEEPLFIRYGSTYEYENGRQIFQHYINGKWILLSCSMVKPQYPMAGIINIFYQTRGRKIL